MHIDRIDHLVLTCASVDATVDFYRRVLGMQAITFQGDRRALVFGRQKFNLHEASAPRAPHAAKPTTGSADFCLITTVPIAEVVAHLQAQQVPIEQGPVPRSGATGPIESVYFRDPDQNLVEVSNYPQ